MNFDYSRLKDPSYFRENRLDAHSDHMIYADRLEWEMNRTSLRMSLNGLWKFHHARNEQQVIPGFESSGYDCRSWESIPVPAHIQMEGYGVPQYTNHQYPWDGHAAIQPGELPEEFNPVACYAKYFYLPESMAGKRVFISFQGVESCVVLWLNGHYVGFSSDTFSPSEFELTPYLVDGENKIACRVYRWCSGSWLEDQDFMRMSGIFREVYLYAAPEVHLEDLNLKPVLDENLQNGRLEIGMKLLASCPWSAELKLLDAKDAVVAETLCSDSREIHTCSMEVPSPEKWSAEHPYLYSLEITLMNESGTVQEYIREKIGFRRFEIRDGLMLLNGRRIVFKGVNRHDFCAETGRAVPEETIRRDLLTMKRNNINAVRTSHYPNPSCLYRLADELGLYVMDENNLETHGTWGKIQDGPLPLSHALPGDRMEWLEILKDRARTMYERDKNHASILIWSCGNEAYGGKVIYDLSQYMRSLDSSRPVHYEGVYFDPRYPDTTDVYSRMYPSVKELREYLKNNRTKPCLLCEYAHAMGNSCGALHKYTEFAYEEPLYQGGFLWDFIDQSILVTNRFGREAYRYGGDYGDHPHDGNFSGNGIVYGSGEETTKMQEVKYCYQDLFTEITKDGAKIINRSLFTNSSAFLCEAILRRDGEIIARANMETDVEPLSEKIYPLPFAAQTLPGEYVAEIQFRQRTDTPWAPMGHEVAFGQGSWRVEGQKEITRHAPLKVVEGLYNLGVHGESFRVIFSYVHGGLESYRWGEKELFKGLPMPNFWRAPIDNDRGNFMPMRYAQWKIASMYASAKYPPEVARKNDPAEHWMNDDGSVSIRFIYTLPTTPAAQCSVTYTVHSCGTVDVDLDYDPVPGLSEMPEFGMLMRMDASYKNLKWYGAGPDETYLDRRHGSRLGIWKTTVPENLPHYLKPQECGNRTDVRWAEVTDARGRGLRFTGDSMFFSALHHSPHELENALHEDELPPANYTFVKAALKQMGVGGDDSWGARTHDEYLLDCSSPLHFRFSFVGVT